MAAGKHDAISGAAVLWIHRIVSGIRRCRVSIAQRRLHRAVDQVVAGLGGVDAVCADEVGERATLEELRPQVDQLAAKGAAEL